MRNRLHLTCFLCVAVSLMTAAAFAKPASGHKQKTNVTANHLSYDYATSAIVFEGNVRVEDPQYTMTADRMIIMMEGTNDVRQIIAQGNVIVVNANRSARCPEAVYTRKTGDIVMSGPSDTSVQLSNDDDKIWGRKITIWLDEQRMECEPARLSLEGNPAKIDGKAKNGDPKRVLP